MCRHIDRDGHSTMNRKKNDEKNEPTFSRRFETEFNSLSLSLSLGPSTYDVPSKKKKKWRQQNLLKNASELSLSLCVYNVWGERSRNARC
ncbi:hypothetical protein OAV88_03160 [bacterium]|nr:hypothetical protein [bacterium]